jgi:hypothetical protein
MIRPASEKGLAATFASRRKVANHPRAILSLASAPLTADSLWDQLPDATEFSS